MATKVSLENNILKIDDGVKILYWNAGWCAMAFSDNNVFIRNYGEANYVVKKIPFAEFQDGSGASIATEVLIATYLSDKIG